MPKNTCTCFFLDFPGEEYAERIRDLRSSLQNKARNGGRKALVTSSQPGVGKTTLCINLAAAFLELNQKTLLVDMDIFSFQLSSLLADPTHSYLHPAPSRMEGVFLQNFPARRTDQESRMLLDQAFRQELRAEWGEFDFVLADCPALSVSKEQLSLAGLVDGALMVLSEANFRGTVEGHHSEDLRDYGIDLWGSVIN